MPRPPHVQLASVFCIFLVCLLFNARRPNRDIGNCGTHHHLKLDILSWILKDDVEYLSNILTFLKVLIDEKEKKRIASRLIEIYCPPAIVNLIPTLNYLF